MSEGQGRASGASKNCDVTATDSGSELRLRGIAPDRPGAPFDSAQVMGANGGNPEVEGLVRVFLTPLQPADSEALLRFELENRAFFESSIPGRGYATQAVGLVVHEAFDTQELHRLEAAASPSNIGSQIALIRNGFEFVGRARNSFRLHGAWHDSVLVERVDPLLHLVDGHERLPDQRSVRRQMRRTSVATQK